MKHINLVGMKTYACAIVKFLRKCKLLIYNIIISNMIPNPKYSFFINMLFREYKSRLQEYNDTKYRI